MNRRGGADYSEHFDELTDSKARISNTAIILWLHSGIMCNVSAGREVSDTLYITNGVNKQGLAITSISYSYSYFYIRIRKGSRNYNFLYIPLNNARTGF